MKAIKTAQTIRTVQADPLGYIVDSIIRILVNLLIPFPVIAEMVVHYRGPVIAFLGGVVIMGLFLLVTMVMVIMTPFWASETFLQRLTGGLTGISNIPIDGSFIASSIPMQTPFGGTGLQYASITAGFMDPSYYLTFGENHTGIDLVPSEAYFKNNESYRQNHQVVVYATMTGTAKYYVDQHGGLTVENTNPEQTVKTIQIHMKQVFVKTGDSLRAGTPIGIMGRTGHATGEHVHYEVRIKSGGGWISINPLIYIR